jgi:AcrR family transcriptional regulator
MTGMDDILDGGQIESDNPSTAKASGTKDRLIAAARELMIERNAVDFSLQDVAARSGFNSALVKYHFGNKDGLLLAILERDAAHSIAQVRRLASLDVSPIAKLEAHIKGVIETYYRRPYLNRLVRLMMADGGDAAAEQVARVFVRPLTNFHADLLAEGVQSGEFIPIDPMFFYHAVIGACENLFSNQRTMRRVFTDAPLNDDLCQRFTAFVIRLVTRGIVQD